MRAVGLVLLAAAVVLAHAPSVVAQPSRAEGPEWIASATVGPAVKGVPATLEVEIASRAGFHVNEEYPLSFRPTPSAGADFAKPRFDRADGLTLEACAGEGRDACRARLPVAFTPTAVGTLMVAGTVSFSVCNPEKCLIQKEELRVPVEVSER